MEQNGEERLSKTKIYANSMQEQKKERKEEEENYLPLYVDDDTFL